MKEKMSPNSIDLEHDLQWFNSILETRIQLYFEQECCYKSIYELEVPCLDNSNSPYAMVIKQHNFSIDERIVFLLALIPHVKPQLLDTLFIHNNNFNRPYTEFGGWKGSTHGGFLPTGETATFIIAGDNLDKRFQMVKVFEEDHFFSVKNILKLQGYNNNEPLLSGGIVITAEYLYKCTTGETHKPDYSTNFPAKLVATKLAWEDLVLSSEIFEEIEHVNAWLKYENTIMVEWQLDKIIKPGYRCLFYGPPGTGKTLTAGLIGKHSGLDVYRIDLSMIVSKYIGETEKNLSNVFDQAEHKNWILFFDEADSLFGKRTQASSSNDRHANQEVSYLLQRIEDFPGIIILATNLKSNLDEAFARRFQSIINFPMPQPEQRLQLWKNMISKAIKLSDTISLDEIASEFELAGGSITNIIRHCVIKSLQNNYSTIPKNILLEGISKELKKEGKIFNLS